MIQHTMQHSNTLCASSPANVYSVSVFMSLHCPVPQQEPVVEVQRFDPARTKPCCVHVLVGNRGSGKTTAMMQYLLQTKERYKTGLVVSRVWELHDSHEQMRKIFPDMTNVPQHAFKSFTQALQTLQCQQKRHHTFVVLDDSFFHGNDVLALKRLVHNSKTHTILISLSCYGFKKLAPTLRPYIDYLYVFHNWFDRPGTWDLYGCIGIPHYEAHHRLCTAEPFTCLVADTTSTEACGWGESTTRCFRWKTDKDPVTKWHAALTVQRHVRGWLFRKMHLWNPHTDLGRRRL